MTTSTTAERPFAPDYAIPPGATVADLLEERGMTQTELARRLGVSLKHVNQTVKGTASISAELALGLEKVFGVPAAFWLNRESLYRADVARREERHHLASAKEWARRFPVKELKARGFIPQGANGPELAEALLRFFGIASPRQWSDPTAAFRKSLKFESDPHALAAWLRVGELEASQIECEPFDSDRFLTALATARSLTRLDPQTWHSRLVEVCAEAGVAVVIVGVLSGTRANGATRWVSPTKAVIQLSLRYSWEDIFWFSFFHEAGHVVLHRKKDLFVEPAKRSLLEGASPDWRQREDEADRFAMRTLIPPKHDRMLRQLTLREVPMFADRLGIAPAIVVGRLHHEGLLPYSHGNKFRRRFEFADD
jgi:HTH-type transcriptional regulator / antitoxin HigA